MNFYLGLCTAGSRKEAGRIGKALVEKSLAACVSVIPGVRSFFPWQGQFCEEKEILLLIKTNQGRLREIINNIKKLHSYSVPEILFVKIEGGEEKYLDWLGKMVGRKRRRTRKKSVDTTGKKR